MGTFTSESKKHNYNATTTTTAQPVDSSDAHEHQLKYAFGVCRGDDDDEEDDDGDEDDNIAPQQPPSRNDDGDHHDYPLILSLPDLPAGLASIRLARWQARH